jgi:hypothetical protein
MAMAKQVKTTGKAPIGRYMVGRGRVHEIAKREARDLHGSVKVIVEGFSSSKAAPLKSRKGKHLLFSKTAIETCYTHVQGAARAKAPDPQRKTAVRTAEMPDDILDDIEAAEYGKVL